MCTRYPSSISRVSTFTDSARPRFTIWPKSQRSRSRKCSSGSRRQAWEACLAGERRSSSIRVRRLISAKQSLGRCVGFDVCREWHKLGGRGSATMMFGHIETYAERIEHLDRLRLRSLQDETGGFTAFIPLDLSAEQHTGCRRLRRSAPSSTSRR